MLAVQHACHKKTKQAARIRALSNRCVVPISYMGRATCIIILNRSTTYITTYKEPGSCCQPEIVSRLRQTTCRQAMLVLKKETARSKASVASACTSGSLSSPLSVLQCGPSIHHRQLDKVMQQYCCY